MQCPLLCKEFIIDAWQLYYARTKGADAVLLIAAVLPDLDIKYMIKICKLLGMTALVEVCLILSHILISSTASHHPQGDIPFTFGKGKVGVWDLG